MKRGIIILAVCAVFLCGCGVNRPASAVPDAYVLIDAGHGGFDGGAVASDNSCEKEYNLAMAICLRDMLVVCGVPVRMTRDTDTALADSKAEDMRGRLALYEGAETVISIHQNHFSNPRYYGTQTFYSDARPDSRVLAESIQNTVVNGLQPNNKRPLKEADSGVFLMKNTTSVAVLVECGFLSNPEELSRLKSADYRQQLSFAIMLGYWNYQCQK